jgi:dimethylhistidine N-methyltransferase
MTRPLTITSPAVAGSALAVFAAEVRAGLTMPGQKELPSKYFYNEVGSALFEVITVLPEYGLSRAGERLLSRHADELIDLVPLPLVVTELGSGSGKNTRLILEALALRQAATRFYPIDVSPAAIAHCKRVLRHLDTVRVSGIKQPYLEGLAEAAGRRRGDECLFVLFLGGNIGNLDRLSAEEFLWQVRRQLNPDDRLLVGADLEKPIPMLLAAYDDPLGVTAAFNLNLLSRINRELEADFDLSRFQHVALYNQAERRIEMHLRSTIDQVVAIRRADITVAFRRDETIWTESSHRYRRGEIAESARRIGFHCEAEWVDEAWPFAHTLLVAD